MFPRFVRSAHWDSTENARPAVRKGSSEAPSRVYRYRSGASVFAVFACSAIVTSLLTPRGGLTDRASAAATPPSALQFRSSFEQSVRQLHALVRRRAGREPLGAGSPPSEPRRCHSEYRLGAARLGVKPPLRSLRTAAPHQVPARYEEPTHKSINCVELRVRLTDRASAAATG